MRKKHLLAAAGLLAVALNLPARQTAQVNMDSIVPIYAYFTPGDTIFYVANTSRYKIQHGDTLKTAGGDEHFCITCLSENKKGYRMEMTLLSTEPDYSVQDTSAGARWLTDYQKRMGNYLTGVKIRFTTDKYGKILHYDNLKEVKQNADQLLQKTLADAKAHFPELDSLKAAGFDIETVLKRSTASDALLKGYTEEIECLLRHHGKVFSVQEKRWHEDETDDTYASDNYLLVQKDPETARYSLQVSVTTQLPVTYLYGLVYGSLNLVNAPDSVKQQMMQLKLDNGQQVEHDYTNYFADGWPERYFNRTSLTFTLDGELSGRIEDREIFFLKYREKK